MELALLDTQEDTEQRETIKEQLEDKGLSGDALTREIDRIMKPTEYTGMKGRHYDIVSYDHTDSLDIHFKLNDMEYVLPVTLAELSEITYDLAQLITRLK